MEQINVNETFDDECVETIEGYKQLAKKHRNIIRHLKAELAWTAEKMITYKKYGEFYASPDHKKFIIIMQSFFVTFAIAFISYMLSC